MPRVIDAQGVERELTEAQYESAARKWVDADSAPDLAKVHRDGPDKVRLYDTVDGTWTRPFNRNQAYTQFLRLVVLRCTACTFTTAYNGQVAQHISQVRAHQAAKAEPDSEGTERCTACGARARPSTIRQHIATAVSAIPSHKEARELTTRRYALEPSGPVAPPPARVAIEAGPHGTEEARRQATRPRRRRRRHSRGGQ